MKKDLNRTKEQLAIELQELRNNSKEREEKLVAANQQLFASEQQMRASNQQLEANNQQLSATEQQLRAANQQFEASNQQLQASEQMLKIQTYNLGERIKELNCFYDISKIVEIPNISLEEIFQRTVELIPVSWQYPDITVSRIIMDGMEYKTPDFQKTKWSQCSDIIVDGNHVGEIEVCYLKKMPDSDEGPFMKEERLLLGALAERLGKITERMQVEISLMTNKKRWKQAQTVAKIGNWEFDLATGTIWASEEAFRIYGIKLDLDENPNHILPLDQVEACIPEQKMVSQALVDLIQENKKYNLEYDVIREVDGERIVIHSVAEQILDDKGTLIKISGTLQNITERKQVEEALIQKKEQLELVMQGANLGWWDWDIPSGKEIYNEILTKNLGYELSKIEPNISWWEGKIHPDDVNQVSLDLQEHFDGKTEYYINKHRLKTKTGEWKWFIDHGKVIEWDKNGKPIRMIGTLRDIDKQERAEKELTKLSAAVTQSPSVIAITDITGNFEYVNPKFTELTGYSLDEAIGHNPRILKSGEQPDEIYSELWETVSSGKVWHGEFHNKKKNGELFWESASISPIFDEQGKIISYIKVAEDITQRKRNEQIQNIIYQISNASAISNNPEEFMVLVKNQLGAIIDTSNFYVALYDSAEDTISLLHHDDKKDKIETFPAGKTLTRYVIKTKKSLLATKKVKKELEGFGEMELLGTDSKVWLGVPLFAKGKVSGVIAVQSYENEKAYDKTDMKILEIISHQISISLERKKAEQDLKSALEKAQESDRLKSAFLLNMSHEIRTPMNGILGFIGLLKEPHLSDDDKDEYIKIIEQSSERMLNTIADIVDISRIEAGQVKVVNSETSVNKILDEQYKFFNLEASSKGLELIYKPTLSENESQIITDKHKLEGILINLIKNAIKFTHNGTISFGCSLKTEKDIEKLEFYVADTGIGIPSDRIVAIFNRFEKADIEDRKVYEGSGLGLAISQSYAEMLGGNISVTSQEGSGTTFTFTIPYKQIMKEPNIEQPEKKEEHTSLGNLSVIIAEDDEVSQLFLKAAFKNKFHKITYTETGREAIDSCRENPETDVILMDIKMPDINGYDATREIRKFNKKVVIIAQTAFGLTGDREKAIDAGCNDYISKPINANELLTLIQKYFKK